MLVGELETEVRAWQHVVVHLASRDIGDGAVGIAVAAVAVHRIGARTLVGAHVLQADVAAHGDAGQRAVHIELGERGAHFFVDDPVLVVDGRIAFFVKVVHRCCRRHRIEHQYRHAGVAGIPHAGVGDRARGKAVGAAALDGAEEFAEFAALGAVRQVHAHIDVGEEQAIGQVALGRQAHGLDLIGHLRILDVRGLGVVAAPARDVGQADDVRIRIIETGGELLAARHEVHGVERAHGAVAGGTGVGFHDVFLAGGLVVAEVQRGRPVLAQARRGFPAGRFAGFHRFVAYVGHDCMHVVESAAHHVVAVQDRVAQLARRFVLAVGGDPPVVQARLPAVAHARVLVLRVEQVERAVEVAVGAKLQHGHGAVARIGLLLGPAFHAVVRHVDGGAVVVERTRAPRRESRGGRAIVLQARRAQRDTDGAVGELVDVRCARAGAVAFLFQAHAAFRLAGVEGDGTLAEVQRTHGEHVGGAGQPLAHQRAVRCFIDRHAAQQLGRVLVELHAAAVAGRYLFAAVEQRGGKVGRHAADADRLCTAGGTLRGHAGQAGDRFGDAGVGQLADVFRRNRFHDRVAVFLDRDGILDTAADTGDDHAGDGGSCRRRFLRCRCCGKRSFLRSGGRGGCSCGFLGPGIAGQGGGQQRAGGGDRVQMDAWTVRGVHVAISSVIVL